LHDQLKALGIYFSGLLIHDINSGWQKYNLPIKLVRPGRDVVVQLLICWHNYLAGKGLYKNAVKIAWKQ